jgi:hypothetical protein
LCNNLHDGNVESSSSRAAGCYSEAYGRDWRMGEVGLGGFGGVLADLCGISTMLAMRLDEAGWEDKMRDNAKGVSETREGI